jgi:hypothetical protein
MIRLIAVLDKVFSLIHLIIWNAKNKKAQDERDKLEEEPFNFFVGHFGGVSNATNEKSKTDKANIEDSIK